MPNISFSTSLVCCPSSGAGPQTLHVEGEIFMGDPSISTMPTHGRSGAT